MLRLERITKENLEYAVSIQEELFPEESGRLNYEESMREDSSFEYWLLYDGDQCVGVTGMYTYPINPESAWLGWFGIREPFRQRHYGSEAMRLFEKHAAQKHYKYARLYTDAYDNDIAISFYRSNGYTEEPYMNPDDPACIEWPMLIFSKALSSDPLIPWGSRNIGLTAQIRKQEAGQNRKKR